MADEDGELPRLLFPRVARHIEERHRPRVERQCYVLVLAGLQRDAGESFNSFAGRGTLAVGLPR